MAFRPRPIGAFALFRSPFLSASRLASRVVPAIAPPLEQHQPPSQRSPGRRGPGPRYACQKYSRSRASTPAISDEYRSWARSFMLPHTATSRDGGQAVQIDQEDPAPASPSARRTARHVVAGDVEVAEVQVFVEAAAVVQQARQAGDLRDQAAFPAAKGGGRQPRRGQGHGLVQGQHVVQLLDGEEAAAAVPGPDVLGGGDGSRHRHALRAAPIPGGPIPARPATSRGPATASPAGRATTAAE